MQIFRKIDTALGWALGEGARIMFWIFASVVLIVCLAYQMRAASFPYQLDYGEAPLVDQAMRLAEGQNIYRADLSAPPYTISNYPPLYVTLLALSVNLVGPASTFAVGRIISILAIWAASLCVGLIIYYQTRDRFAAGVSAVVMLAFPYIVIWSPLLRIDSLALALSLGGLALLAARPTSTRNVIIASLLIVAAIYTRQSYALAAPLAGFIWLLSHDKRKAVYFALLVGGSSLILFLILNGVTRGGFFFNIVTANVNEFKMDILEYQWNRMREIALIPLIFGVVSLFLIRRLNPLWMLAAPYLIGTLISAATIGKIGSNVNYLLELCASLSLAAGIVIATSQKHMPVQTVRAVILFVLAIGLVRMVHFTLQDYARDLIDRRASIGQLGELSTLVAEIPGEILTDEYMGMLTLQGRPLSIQPFEVTQLAWAGMWDQTPLLNSIQNKEYAAIIIYDKPWANERWTQEMFDAIKESYVLSEIVSENKVYLPYRERTTTTLQACPGASWQFPSDGTSGVRMKDGAVDFFGVGNAGMIPVYAVADGLLTRRTEWVDAVAIQHSDPLNPDATVWSFYGDMVAANETESFISDDFPPGSKDIPVKAGQLLGYQGSKGSKPMWPMWVHIHFAMIAADEDGSLPEEITQDRFIDPAPYLGLDLSAKNEYSQPVKCIKP